MAPVSLSAPQAKPEPARERGQDRPPGATACEAAAPEPSPPGVALASLPPGSRARVLAVLDEASPVGRRLLDLGFTPGSRLRVVRRAPLGDPVEYELRSFRICLRRSEAERIRVETT